MNSEERIYEDDHLVVVVTDQKGAGGARHEYHIKNKHTGEVLSEVSFQNGNRLENGVNGATNEAYLAIVAHRCQDFMAGPFPHHLTLKAQHGAEFALDCLEQRTAERQERGVEGQEKA